MKKSKQQKNIGTSYWYVEREVSYYERLSHSYLKCTIYERWKGRNPEEVEVGDLVLILEDKIKGLVESIERYSDGVLKVFVNIESCIYVTTSERVGILNKK